MTHFELFHKIAEIFSTAQRNSATHAKGVQKLKSVYLEADHNEFMLSTKKIIHTCLKTDFKISHPFVERIVQFVSSFCVTMQEYHLKNVNPDTDSEFVSNIISFLIQMSQMAPDSIRHRSCEFISRIFASMTGYDLTVDLCDAVQEAMLCSLEDKIPQIRIQAVNALAPLQSLDNMHCPIITAFVDHMEFDNSAKVRKMCAEKIALKREIIPQLIETSRDVDINVKLTVYKRALKYPNHFKITHKQQLIKNGYQEQSTIISNFIAQELIPAWLQYYEMNYIKLLSALRLDSNWNDIELTTKVAEFTLSTLFALRPTTEILDVLKFDERKLLKFDQLNWDTVSYWRIFMKHLRKINSNCDEADDYIPQIPDFRNYIEEYCSYSVDKLSSSQDVSHATHQFKFILTQLFHIIKDYDFCDITCRRTTNELIQHVLKLYNLDLEVIKVIILTLNKTLPNINDQSSFICDLLGELMYSLPETKANTPKETNTQVSVAPQAPDVLNSTQQDYRIAQIKIKHYQLTIDLEEALKVQDYAKATVLKPQIDELAAEISALVNPSVAEEEVVEETVVQEDGEEAVERETDPVIIKRVLTVMAGFLTSSNIKTLNSTLRTFKVSVIDEMLHSENLNIKIGAMRCLGLCCSIDEHTAKMAIGTYSAIIITHNKNTQYPPPQELVIISIGTIIDTLLLFGTKLFATTPDATLVTDSFNEEEQEVLSGGYSLSDIVRELLDLLNDESPKIQEITGRGICNFILTSRISSHAILSRLILKFVSPIGIDEESLKLQQYIGLTLGKLPSIPGSGIQLNKAIIPAIKIIVKAPQNNPLSSVDLDNVTKLLLDLTCSFTEWEELHQNMAESLLKEIRERPNSPNNLTFSKMLLLLKYSRINKVFLNCVLEKIDDIKDRVLDSKVMGNVVKLNTKITLLLEETNDNGLEPVIEEAEPEEAESADS